jgi:hypothetical protein
MTPRHGRQAIGDLDCDESWSRCRRNSSSFHRLGTRWAMPYRQATPLRSRRLLEDPPFVATAEPPFGKTGLISQIRRGPGREENRTGPSPLRD